MRSRRNEGALTDDAVLGGRLRLLQPRRGHRAGHDAILLAAAAPKAKHAVDLGAGVGTAGLALLARNAAERVTLVEIDAQLAALARQNAERNGYADRTQVVVADVAKLGTGFVGLKSASADLVLANPPFNDPARHRVSPDASRRRAHVAGTTTLENWARAAERLLKPGGTFVLIHRPEAIDTVLASLAGRFGAIELIPIHPKPGAPAIRVIVRATKSRRTPLRLLAGFSLADVDGRPARAAEAVLREASALSTLRGD